MAKIKCAALEKHRSKLFKSLSLYVYRYSIHLIYLDARCADS